MEEGRSFWRITMRSQRRHCFESSGGIPAQDRTADFQRYQQRVGAAAGAAADAAVGLVVGGSVVVPTQAL